MKHDFAKKLRREQTDVECRLWYALRSRHFLGFKFRRQQPIGPYVVDFVCFDAKLVIELDGGQHGSNAQIVYDAARSKRLATDGFRIMHFTNTEMIENLDGVLEGIERTLPPSPAKSST